MSKIQDALGRMRGDKTASSTSSGEHRPKKYLTPASSGEYDNHPSTSAGFASGSLAIESFAKINIDRSRLIEYGLVPRGVDNSELPEQFRRIKRPLLQLAFGNTSDSLENCNVAMVASALPGAGKSFCSYQLSLSIARERDIGVILIDADVVKPLVSDALGLSEQPGLIDYLLDPDKPLNEIFFNTNMHGIIAVPSGQKHPEATELLASRRMEQFINRISKEFPSRIVLLDTPPLLMTNEAQVLVDRAGQIVLVIDAGATTQDSVLHALEALNRDKPINAILNKTRGLNAGAYGYGYRDRDASGDLSIGD